MQENWKQIENFPNYQVSSDGRIRTDKSGRILVQYENQSGLIQVGLMQDGIQKHRSVPLLVAKAFIPEPPGPFDTPINLDGDRYNNRVENLMWRPRWFAIKYNQQFRFPRDMVIDKPLEDLETGIVSENSFECSKQYGILEHDLVFSIVNRTYIWPTYQQFRVIE